VKANDSPERARAINARIYPVAQDVLRRSISSPCNNRYEGGARPARAHSGAPVVRPPLVKLSEADDRANRFRPRAGENIARAARCRSLL
jgi:hypothetical protein